MQQEISRLKEIPFQESNLETIDGAMYEWLKDKMRLHTYTNDGWKEVPIIWASSERTFIAKKDKELRDSKGSMNYPIITLERKNVTKNLTIKGTVFANIPPIGDVKGGVITVAKRIKQDKTSEFGSVENKKSVGQLKFPRKNNKVVYETISIPIPVYIEITYNIYIRTIYQQQMNELLQPFITFPGNINYFTITKDNHRYEAFMQQEFANNSNSSAMGPDERKIDTTLEIKVLGYLIGKGKNEEQPKIVVRENIVDVKMMRERVVLNDEPEHTNKQKYVGMGSMKGVKDI